MYSIMGNLIENMMSDIEKHVPTVYIQNSPEGLEDAMQAAAFDAHINYLKASDDTESIRNSIRSGDADLLVIFDAYFLDTINAYSNNGDAIPEVKTFYNPSEEYSSAARSSFVNGAIEAYRQTLLAKRIGNVEQLQIFYVDRAPESSVIMDEEKATGKSLSMLLPFLINIMLFQGAMSLGVDTITG
jgi:sodium transport system permease protein